MFGWIEGDRVCVDGGDESERPRRGRRDKYRQRLERDREGREKTDGVRVRKIEREL